MGTIDASGGSNKTDRRDFFARLSGWAMAAAAFVGIPGCDGAAESAEDDFSMHGPVQVSDWALRLPEAPSAAPLFAPYSDGRPFLRRWAIGRVSRGPRDQLVVLAVDVETGGHAEIEVYAHDPAIDPIDQFFQRRLKHDSRLATTGAQRNKMLKAPEIIGVPKFQSRE